MCSGSLTSICPVNHMCAIYNSWSWSICLHPKFSPYPVDGDTYTKAIESLLSGRQTALDEVGVDRLRWFYEVHLFVQTCLSGSVDLKRMEREDYNGQNIQRAVTLYSNAAKGGKKDFLALFSPPSYVHRFFSRAIFAPSSRRSNF